MKSNKNTIWVILITMLVTRVNALENNTGLWAGVAVVGPTKWCTDIKYYYDMQIQFLDTHYKFEEAYASIGIGKEYKNWLFFLINTFEVHKSFTGETHYTNKLYQEANWHRTFYTGNRLSIRSRLEERKRFSESTIHLRWRERCMLRIPFSKYSKYNFVLADEIFLHLNRPKWVTDLFFSQNRVFIGIGKTISEFLTLDIGYLNKLLLGDSKRIENILVVNFNFTRKADYIAE